MSAHRRNLTVADRARQAAEYIGLIADAATGNKPAALQFERPLQLVDAIQYDMEPVLDWVERRQGADTAAALHARVYAVLSAMDEAPEKTPSGNLILTLLPEARRLATHLRNRADDIEREESTKSRNVPREPPATVSAIGRLGKPVERLPIPEDAVLVPCGRPYEAEPPAAGADQGETDGSDGTEKSAGDKPQADDPTAYRPASEFVVGDRFPNLKAIRKALAANSWIRTKRPLTRVGRENPQRLLIHAGDWHKYLKQGQAVDPLDLPGEVVDAVMDTEQRKSEIDKANGRK